MFILYLIRALFSLTCNRNCVEDIEKTGKNQEASRNQELRLPLRMRIKKKTLRKEIIFRARQGLQVMHFCSLPLNPVGTFPLCFQDLTNHGIQSLPLPKRRAKGLSNKTTNSSGRMATGSGINASILLAFKVIKHTAMVTEKIHLVLGSKMERSSQG